jgi:hypothetical protein
MKVYGAVYVEIHVFLISALFEVEWLASHSSRFTPGKTAHGTHWIGGCVGPRASLNAVEKRKFLTLPRLILWPLSCPADTDCIILMPKVIICLLSLCDDVLMLRAMRRIPTIMRFWSHNKTLKHGKKYEVPGLSALCSNAHIPANYLII